jgi:hypothetical protein
LAVQNLEAPFQLSLSIKDTQEEDIFLGRKRDNFFSKSVIHQWKMLTTDRASEQRELTIAQFI